MKHFSLFIFLIMLPIFASFEAGQVLACSIGIYPSIEDFLTDDHVIVKARPVDVDDLNQNGILHVEHYVWGDGPEYLLFVQNEPLVTNGLIEGYLGSGDCNQFFSFIEPNQPTYYVLSRTIGGYYRSSFVYPRLSFPTPDSLQYVQIRDPDDASLSARQEMTEAGFLAHMTEITDASLHRPQVNLSFPLKAELAITTTAGTTYWLPVDGAPPYTLSAEELDYRRVLLLDRLEAPRLDVCSEQDCRVFSPNGLYAAAQIDESTLRLNYAKFIEGGSPLFSPTSDALAVWTNEILRVFPHWSPRLVMAWDLPYRVEPQARYEISLQGDAEVLNTLAGQAAWSPDGGILAYSDAGGLWLLDVITPDAEPQLLLPVENDHVPVAQFFSPFGRYLAVTQGAAQFTLDMVSGVRYPYGLLSPDERFLLSMHDAEVDELQVCSLLRDACQNIALPLVSTMADDASTPERIFYAISQVEHLEWMNTSSFLMFGCSSLDTNICGLSTTIVTTSGHWWTAASAQLALAYAYDHQNNTLAILANPTTVIIEGQRYELGDYLDGNIVSIQWGESLFYHE